MLALAFAGAASFSPSSLTPLVAPAPAAARRIQMEAKADHGTRNVRIIGVGASAPSTRVSNAELEAVVETSDEWIAKRTGGSKRLAISPSRYHYLTIHNPHLFFSHPPTALLTCIQTTPLTPVADAGIRARHLLGPDEGLSDLATAAAASALEQAGVDAADVELVILATSSPDDLFGDAPCVARSIGATNAVAFDLTAACSGFLFGMNTASQFLHTGAYKTAVVIGADALSRWVDWKDRNTCVLFGDGAGAVVMRAAEGGEEPGLLGFEMHSNGAGRPDLNCGYDYSDETRLAGVATVTSGAYKPIDMNGKEVFKFATTCVPKVLREGLENAGVTPDDLDWVLLHQANIRIMETVAKKLGVPMEKVLTNLDEYGNTSAGSIPLCLNQAVKEGKVKNGDLIAVAGFGAGLSWGSAVIRWGA